MQISTDGETWDVLATHTEDVQNYPTYSKHVQVIEPSDLSAYVGAHVHFRFHLEITDGNYYDGIDYDVGFYFDNFHAVNTPYGEWQTVSNTISVENRSITLAQNGDCEYRVRAYADGQWWDWSNTATFTLNAPELRARVYLEGPWEGGTMKTDLNIGNVIPNHSPYAEAPACCDAIPDTIVDWVLVELRETTDGPSLDQRSALVSQNGYLCNTTGTQGMVFDVPDGDYYVVIRHRTHLAVMGAATVAVHAPD